MTDWTDHRETLEIESNCHKALLDSPVAHSRVAEAIDAALAQIDRLTVENERLRSDLAMVVEAANGLALAAAANEHDLKRGRP